jgi:hypothetical protein
MLRRGPRLQVVLTSSRRQSPVLSVRSQYRPRKRVDQALKVQVDHWIHLLSTTPAEMLRRGPRLQVVLTSSRWQSPVSSTLHVRVGGLAFKKQLTFAGKGSTLHAQISLDKR